MKSLLQDDQKLLHHGSIMVMGTLVGALCNAGFHMVVGRILPITEYGSLVAMLNVILVATTPLLALQNTVAHFTARAIQESRHADVMPMCAYWFKVLTIIGLTLVAVAWLTQHRLSLFWQGLSPAVIVLTFGVLAISMFMSLFNGVLQGLQAFGWLASVPQAWGAVRLILGGCLTALIGATAGWAIVAQGMGVVVTLALSILALIMLGERWPRYVSHPSGIHRYMGASFVCLVGYAMLMNLDTMLIKHYFDSEMTGIFAKAATIARTAVFLPVPIAAVLFPKVVSSGQRNSQSWKLLCRALGFSGIIILLTVGVCVGFPQLPWTILYGKVPADQPNALFLTRAMVLAMGPLAVTYLLMNFEMAQRRFRWCLILLPCAFGYVLGVRCFHSHPGQLAAVLGVMNILSCLLLLCGIFHYRQKAPSS